MGENPEGRITVQGVGHGKDLWGDPHPQEDRETRRRGFLCCSGWWQDSLVRRIVEVALLYRWAYKVMVVCRGR